MRASGAPNIEMLMKKLILIVLLALGLSAAQAQTIFGGTIGGSYSNTLKDIHRVDSLDMQFAQPGHINSLFYIMPKFGYEINENMQAGVAFGAQIAKETTYDTFLLLYEWKPGFEGWRSKTNVMWVVEPYFRYSLPVSERVSLFAELQGHLSGCAKQKNYFYQNDSVRGNIHIPATYNSNPHDTTWFEPTRTFDWSVAITPGLNIKLGDNCSIDFYLEMFRLAFSQHRVRTFIDHAPGAAVPNTEEQITLNNQWQLGLNASAQTIADHFNVLRVSFNYHF